MNKSFYIVGNWKMNKNVHETEVFFENVSKLYPKFQSQINQQVKFGLALPYTNLFLAKKWKKIDPQRFLFGSQNLHQKESGAYTGEISASMLQSFNVDLVIIGHSERRAYFCETNTLINEKLHLAIKNHFLPILCVGETLEEYESKNTKKVIEHQLEVALKGIDTNKIIIAYEPIWAIGTGKTATPEIAQDICAFIRSKINNQNTCIQYGGSMKVDNVKALMAQKDIDGGLIGGASLEAESFLKLGIF